MPRIDSTARFGSAFRSIIVTLFASALAAGSVAAVAAQGATPDVAPPSEGMRVVIQSPDEEGFEQAIGTANLLEENGVVTISVEVEGLEPGEHGIHIHEIGICDAAADEPYSTAGEHFNPSGASHGPGPQGDATPAEGASESHAGDLGNITIGDDGTGTLEVSTDRVSLDSEAENTLADQDGSTLLIHENPDDLETDPSGESGARIACGVIFAGLDATPVAEG